MEFEHVKRPVLISVSENSFIWNKEENKVVVKDLGTKLTCQGCEAKFFDLKKKKPICPKCEKEYVVVKIRTRRTTAKSEKTNEVVDSEKIEKENVTETVADAPTGDANSILSDDSVENIDIPEVEDNSEEDNNTLIEDTSDIGDDDDDIAGVIVNSDTSPEIV